jgi:histidine decarboxylase
MNRELTPADIRDRLDAKWAELQAANASHFGYPVNADFDYSALWRFLGVPLNNIGDPFSASSYRVNTHDFEREVIEVFSRLAPGSANGRLGLCHQWRDRREHVRLVPGPGIVP